MGTLEFLCDFHEQCHNTQDVLSERKKRKQMECEEPPPPLELPEDAADSNKENESPPPLELPEDAADSNKENESPPSLELPEDAEDSDKENVSPIVRGKKRSMTNLDGVKKSGKITSYFKKSLATNADETRDRINDDRTDKIGVSECRGSSKDKFDDSASTTVSQPPPSPTVPPKNGSIDRKTRSLVSSNIEEFERTKKIKIQKKVVDDSASLNRRKDASGDSSKKISGVPNAPSLPEGERPKTAITDRPEGSPMLGDEAERTMKATKEGSTASMENPRIDRPEVRTLRARKSQCNVKIKEKHGKISVIASKKKISKISDFITNEQREEIEKFYKVDMSVVDERSVGETIVFLDGRKYGCKLCDSTYTRQDKCQVHIWGHLGMKPYRCGACNFSTVTVSNIRCHVRKSHLKIKPYGCELCDKRYTTAFLLEEHANSHTGEKPYGCDICDFTSASRQVLSYHKTTHKPVKDIECHVCGKDFYSKGRLRAHMIIHNKDKAANMCKLCSIYLCNSEALQRHYVNVHSKDYVCDICGKRSKSKKALNNHRNVHSAAKYKCSLCTNVYKSSHILKEHLLKHEGIRKYKCNVCQKDFAQQSHIAAHMAVHSDKRFFCPGCNRSFNRRDNMKMHARRCDAFLANPELKTILMIREARSKSGTKEKSVADTGLTEKEETEFFNNEDDGGNNAEETRRFDNRNFEIAPKVQSSNEIFNSDEDSDANVVVIEKTIVLPCT